MVDSACSACMGVRLAVRGVPSGASHRRCSPGPGVGVAIIALVAMGACCLPARSLSRGGFLRGPPTGGDRPDQVVGGCFSLGCSGAYRRPGRCLTVPPTGGRCLVVGRLWCGQLQGVVFCSIFASPLPRPRVACRLFSERSVPGSGPWLPLGGFRRA
jgi:hypothetical protein